MGLESQLIIAKTHKGQYAAAATSFKETIVHIFGLFRKVNQIGVYIRPDKNKEELQAHDNLCMQAWL